MNWMIDGAYGDDYRTAMGYKAQVPAVDEWELERTLGTKNRPARLATGARAGWTRKVKLFRDWVLAEATSWPPKFRHSKPAP